jgi:hypothetical protein
VQHRVVLELGVRGGTVPNQSRTIGSAAGEFAPSAGVLTPHEYEELEAITVAVLSRERTLVEKLSILHHAASTHESGLKSGVTRHWYDAYSPLGDDSALGAIGQPGFVATLAADVEYHSDQNKWGYTPRPAEWFGASRAFQHGHPSRGEIERAYHATVPDLVYESPAPDLERCVERVLLHKQHL